MRFSAGQSPPMTVPLGPSSPNCRYPNIVHGVWRTFLKSSNVPKPIQMTDIRGDRGS
jgi:hypothetical protein